MIRAKFKIDVRKIQNDVEEKVLLVQKKIAFQLLEGIVDMTPVDTGRARANWQVTIGAPSSAVNPEKFDKAGNPTVEAGRDVINSITTLGAIYLTNNLPYILALEKGHSKKQAPQGMVQVTIDRLSLQLG